MEILVARREVQKAAVRRVTESRAVPPTTPEAGASLDEQIRSVDWYHCLDLGNGRVTPGSFDHRALLEHYQLPADMRGMRALDVATFDGFWAFEFEKRGASDVVAVDLSTVRELDLPPAVRAGMSEEQLAGRIGRGFEIAHRALGSKVRRVETSVHDLDPVALGQFDFVHSGNFLLHLKNPAGALQSIARMGRPGGQALIVDTFHPQVPDEFVLYAGGQHRCVWWHFSLGALERMVRDSGFRKVERLGVFRVRDTSMKSNLHQAAFRAWF